VSDRTGLIRCLPSALGGSILMAAVLATFSPLAPAFAPFDLNRIVTAVNYGLGAPVP
jgi:hypothetical protein